MVGPGHQPSIEYQEVFLRAPVGMCVSRNRVIERANQALESMFGYPPDGLSGRSFQDLYPSPAEFERTGARLVPLLVSGAYADERIMKRASGELFWCHVTGRALIDSAPHAMGIWTFEDLSAQRPVASGLSPREREIATLLVAGKTSKVIARELGLSPRTVEAYRARLMAKYSASTAAELVGRLLTQI